MKPIIKKLGVLVTMLLAFISASAYDFEVDGIYYNIIDESAKEVEVTYRTTWFNTYSGDIIIPTSVTKDNITYGVTSIGESAFKKCSKLASITLPNSVTSIGWSAFEQCSNLGSITLPDSVTSINSLAFEACYSLYSITLPNSVTSIGHRAFKDCSRLYSITFGSGLTSISQYAFDGCSIKKAIWLANTPPDGISYVNASINYIPNNKYNPSNRRIYPLLSSRFEVDNVIYVPVSSSDRTCDIVDCNYNSTSGDFEIDSIVTNKGVRLKVRNVNPYAFYENQSVNTLKISNAGYIGESAFCACYALTTVTASNNGDIEKKAFNYCNALTTVLASNNGCIGELAFYNCDALTTVTASNNGDIEKKAFYDCDALISAKLDNKGLIGTESFYSCDNLSSVTISSTGSIMPSAFKNCTLMGTAIIHNNGYIGEYAFANCNMSEKLDIGKDVTTIGDCAFQNNKKLKQLILPDNISGLGQYAFYACKELEKVSIGKGIPKLPEGVFSLCIALPEISIPANISSIEDYAFDCCSSLSDVTIEGDEESVADNVLKIGSNGSHPIFAYSPLDEVYIGRKLNYSTTSSEGYSPFYNNTSLRAVTITDAETEIYDKEFCGCSNLQSFSCGDGVTKIGNWAFWGCSAMKTYSSGTQVKSIGEKAFYYCTGLTSFTTLAAVPPTCGYQALDVINKRKCTLNVPAESIDDYQSAAQWKEFFFIEGTSGIDEVALDRECEIIVSADALIIDGAENIPVSVYSIDGRMIINMPEYRGDEIRLAKGIYIVRVGSRSKKIMI